MPLSLALDELPTPALRRIARTLIRAALADLDDRAADVHATVHAVRKRCKQLRALVRLFRPAFGDHRAENARFRDLGRRLSGLRDAATLVECHDRLTARFRLELDPDACAAVRRALVQRRDEHEAGLDAPALLAATRAALDAALHRAARWTVGDDDRRVVLRGFERAHRRARTAMESALAAPTTETWHEWRKRTKDHRHHLEFVRALWPPLLDVLHDAARQLGDQLGDDHDLAVLRAVLLAEPARFARRDVLPLLARIDRRRAELRSSSAALGRRLLGASPRASRCELARLWDVGSDERRAGAVVDLAARP